jgi:hypothetical protein
MSKHVSTRLLQVNLKALRNNPIVGCWFDTFSHPTWKLRAELGVRIERNDQNLIEYRSFLS